MIKIENFSCGYGKRIIINNFNGIFHSNKITALIGNSGIGKSTILKSINRLHEIEQNNYFRNGTILANIDNKLIDIYKEKSTFIRKKIGYIFQSPTPLPMSIKRNISFGMNLHSKNIDTNKIEEVLKKVYLWDEVKYRLDSTAISLSLGQQQRLAIARVLALEPDILLFDEPASSLDSIATTKIELLMQELKKTKTIILVTHDKLQIQRICNHTVSLS